MRFLKDIPGNSHAASLNWATDDKLKLLEIIQQKVPWEPTSFPWTSEEKALESSIFEKEMCKCKGSVDKNH